MQTNKSESVWRRFLSARTLLTTLAIAVMAVALPGCPGTMDDPCAVDGVCDDGNLCTTDTCNAVADTNGVMVAECTNTPVDCGTEFCNPADGACVECLADADCDNGDFCDGAETCGADNTCAAGTDPCAADEECDEDTDTCVATCDVDADCPDDGNFCTGDPACTDGTCGFAGDPCAATPDTPVCDETNDACVECLVDGDCTAPDTCVMNVCTPPTPACESDADCADDGLFCNGTEFCDTSGMANACASTGDPCPEGQTCQEDTDTCVVPGGTVFTLTTEADLFVGSAADDTFNAAAGTLNGQGGTIDVLDGGDGDNDTLNATIIGAATGFTPIIVAVEVWNLVSSGANNFFDLSATDGAETVNLTGNADITFEQVTVGACDFNLNDSDDDVTFEFVSLDGTNEFTLGLNGVDGSTITMDSNDGSGTQTLETLNLMSMGADTNAFTFVNGGAQFDDLDETVLTGSGDLNFGADEDVLDGESIDDSDFEGELNLTVSGDLDADFDMADLGTPGFLILTPDNQTGATLLSGVQGGLTVSLNPTGAAAAHVNNTLTFTGSFSGTSTSLNVKLMGTGTGVTGTTSAVGVENFNLYSGGSSANTMANITLDTNPFATEQIVVTGDQDCTISAIVADRIDASDFLGDLDATGSAAANEIIGGTADDTIDGAAGDDLLDGGDGADEITSNDGNDSVTLGDGEDTMVVGHDVGTTFDQVGDFDPDDDVFAIDLSEINAVITNLVNGAGNANVADGDAVDIATVADAGNLIAANSDNIFKLTNTTGINAFGDIDLSNDLIELANNTANGDGVIFMFYDADDGEMNLGVLVDTDSDADSDLDESNSSFDVMVRAAMSAAEYTALANANFDFVP
jgi:hypothetical protein